MAGNSFYFKNLGSNGQIVYRIDFLSDNGAASEPPV
jgi:hypothetical protein